MVFTSALVRITRDQIYYLVDIQMASKMILFVISPVGSMFNECILHKRVLTISRNNQCYDSTSIQFLHVRMQNGKSWHSAHERLGRWINIAVRPLQTELYAIYIYIYIYIHIYIYIYIYNMCYQCQRIKIKSLSDYIGCKSDCLVQSF